MGLFSNLFRSRDAPQNSTAGSAYTFFFGGSTSGKTVTERSAMQMTAVYSCVRILAEAVAGLPLNLYRYTEDGGKEKAIDHPLYLLLHDEPNPEMSSFVFRETLMTHLLLWGNAYAQIIRNGRGEVIALYPLMPNKMSVDRDSQGQLYYTYQRGTDEAIRDKNQTAILRPSDVLHVPGLGFDGLVGYSPIAMAKNAIGMAIACEEYGAKFFANGAAPGGVLEHPGTIKDPQRVRESWQSTFGGSGNANKIAVLEEGMKYTPIGISPEQAQFLETRTGPVWICSTFNIYGKAACASKQIPEGTLEKAAAEVLGLDTFDSKVLHDKITAIRAEGNNILVFLFKDGTQTVKRWADRSRAESWTPEMRATAREFAKKGRAMRSCQQQEQ